MTQAPFPDHNFERVDESPDAFFYEQPRLVNHIDEYAIAAVGEAYRQFLPAGGDFLDLMSSWVSHYPADMEIGSLTGHGMNMVELANNPRLTKRFVQDLNEDPRLPLDDNSFDGVTICVSVQYLTRPVEVFREIGRVLKPVAPLIVAFSNRCFPTKAVALWQSMDDAGHAELVSLYAHRAGCFEDIEAFDVSPRRTMHGVPDNPALRERIASGEYRTDPLLVVVARKIAHA
jgi:SAM-dependent methyltransferase